MIRFLFLLLAVLTLSGCGIVSKLRPGKKEEVSKDDWNQIPRHLRGGAAQESVKIEPAEADRIVDAGVDPASIGLDQGGVAGLPSEADLIFTDPDNVKASEAAIEKLYKVQKKDWFVSHSIAKNQALIESKPLLMVFTNTNGSSPAAAKLEKELLARIDFADWAKEHFVRLRLDYNVKGTKSADMKVLSDALEKRKYLNSLKKRYKVSGFPSMIVVAADGSVTQHVRGYDGGNYEFTWGLLKTAVANSKEKQDELERKLLRKGYRRWQGKNELKILAKLASYKEGELLLIAPNGVRYQTHIKNLSPADRQWLEDEQARRKGS